MTIEIIKFVNCIIFALLDVFLLYSMGFKDELIQFNIKRWTVILSVSIIFLIAANYLVPLSLKMIVIVIMTFILCKLMYKLEIIKVFLRTIIALSIYGVTDTIISFVFVYIFKFNMMYIISNVYYYTLYNLLNILIIMIVAMLFRINKGKLLSQENMSRFAQILLFTITILQIVRICVEFFIWYYIATIPHLQYISVISYICSIFSIGLLLYSTNVIIDKENVIKISNEYNEKLSVYNEVLQNSIENQRKIAHEHGNQLTVLSGYISSGNLEKAKLYLAKVVGTSNVDNEYLSHVKESGLKALLVFKVAMMEKKNIEFETIIDEDLEDTIVPSEDMCNIMGVFLDNALDAVSQLEEPYISLSILKNEYGLVISVMNSVKDSNIDINKIFKKGYSSKGEGRGFGLHIVDEIVKKYEELELQTRVEDGLFIQELHVTDRSISLTKL